jgi:hypothetical protein
MLELYFIFYRVPKMMTRLAREQGGSALLWSLAGIGTWIGAEVVVFVVSGFIYGIGAGAFGWPMPISPGVKLFTYILALAAALGSVTIVSRILAGKGRRKYFASPPPPPAFHSDGTAEVHEEEFR